MDMKGKYLGGLALIGIGVVFLLNQLGISHISIGYLFSTFWPVFLIAPGLFNIFSARHHGYSLFNGLILLAIGSYFMAKNLGWISVSMGDFIKLAIPLLFIAGGLNLLFRPSKSENKHRGQPQEKYESPQDIPPPPPPMESSLDAVFDARFDFDNKHNRDNQSENKSKDDYNRTNKHHTHTHNHSNAHGNRGETINKSGFIGDVHVGQDYFQLKPMNISHFIGDTVIDLTKAQIPYGETRIMVSAFIGDVKVFIPDDMDLGIVATSSSFIGDMKVMNQKEGGMMSNVTVESPNYPEAGKRVKLVVSVFIGDVKVNMVG